MFQKYFQIQEKHNIKHNTEHANINFTILNYVDYIKSLKNCIFELFYL